MMLLPAQWFYALSMAVILCADFALALDSVNKCDSCDLACTSAICRQTCTGYPCNMRCNAAIACSQNCSKGYCDNMACKANLCYPFCEVGHCKNMTCDALGECRLTCLSHCTMTCTSMSCLIICVGGHCQIKISGDSYAAVYCEGGYCNVQCPRRGRCSIKSCPSNTCNITYEKSRQTSQARSLAPLTAGHDFRNLMLIALASISHLLYSTVI